MGDRPPPALSRGLDDRPPALFKGLDDRPPPPVISSSGSGTGIQVSGFA